MHMNSLNINSALAMLFLSMLLTSCTIIESDNSNILRLIENGAQGAVVTKQNKIIFFIVNETVVNNGQHQKLGKIVSEEDLIFKKTHLVNSEQWKTKIFFTENYDERFLSNLQIDLLSAVFDYLDLPFKKVIFLPVKSDF